MKLPLCHRKEIDNESCKGNGFINGIKAYFKGKPVCQACYSDLAFPRKKTMKWLDKYWKKAKNSPKQAVEQIRAPYWRNEIDKIKREELKNKLGRTR